MEDRNPIAQSAVYICAVFLLAYSLIAYFFSIKVESNEPPLVKSNIPYIGHILGLIWKGQRYLEELSAQHRFPIYTIQMLHKKTYVVTAPELIQAVDRSAKTLTFYPFIAMLSPRMFDADEQTMAILTDNINLEKGPRSLCHDVSEAMHKNLLPGPKLDALIEAMLHSFSGFIEDLSPKAGKNVEVDFFKWCLQSFAISNTTAVYGPGNPFIAQPELADDFWAFDEGFSTLLFGIPSPAARRAHAGRARINKAMTEYFQRKDHMRGSPLIQGRYLGSTRYGATNAMAGSFEIGDLIGILVNATPSLFWIIFHIYSDQDLLQDLRAEIDAAVVRPSKGDGSTEESVYGIEVSNLQDDCPLLVSTFREVLRFNTHHAASRWVTEDTMLAGKYLLTKDSVVQVPAGVAHANEASWGGNAASFDARRFLNMDEKAGSGKASRVPAGAYRAWGGGATLCPGRFFAQAEITNAVAMFIARYNLQPVEGDWRMPDAESSRIASSIRPPKGDVKLCVMDRPGFAGRRWQYLFKEKGTVDDV